MDIKEFETLLDRVKLRLAAEAQQPNRFKTPKEFEDRVRELLVELMDDKTVAIDSAPNPQIFPDIVVGKFGIEVKFTTNDTWRSIANSIFEGTRSQDVEEIYVLFGKMGGPPGIEWGRYEDCVMHVRTSHVPRFEVEMNTDKSLFKQFGITYNEFTGLSEEAKMQHIRKYARGRLKPGDRLWWLEGKTEPEHALPLQVRLYMNLSQEEKKKLRAEAAMLSPQIVKPSRSRNKYNDAVMYLLTYRGVLCPQARDLFSAGSVALRADGTRGGKYVLRALMDIRSEMRKAAAELEDALFVEYWGRSVPPEHRISEWLAQANSYARGWQPSEVLFKN